MVHAGGGWVRRYLQIDFCLFCLCVAFDCYSVVWKLSTGPVFFGKKSKHVVRKETEMKYSWCNQESKDSTRNSGTYFRGRM